jgi:glycosyltransferase domain-containing protein
MIDNLSTKDVTIIVPTKNRPDFLFRLLNYYVKAQFKGVIFIGDASNDNFLQENLQIISDFQAKITVEHFVKNMGVNGTIEVLSQKIETTYCLFCADDDFVVPNGIARALTFLKENSDYSAVHGKGSQISLDTDECFGSIISLNSYPQTFVDEETGVERLKSYLMQSYTLLFAVHRTEIWKKMFHGFSGFDWSNSQEMTIDEILSSGVSVILGKIKEIDGLYLIRQSHPNQKLDSDCDVEGLSPSELVLHKDWSIALQDMSNRFIEEIMIVDQIEYDEAKALVHEILLCHIEKSFRVNQKNIEQMDASLKLLLIIGKEVISNNMPSYLKHLLKKILFLRARGQSLLSIKTLNDELSIYYNDFKLIQLACSEKFVPKKIDAQFLNDLPPNF